MSKQKSYDTTFKLKAIGVAEKKSNGAAAREFKVDPKRIREWCNKGGIELVFLKTHKCKRKHLCGGRRRANNEEMEDALFSWIIDLRQRTYGCLVK